jgi:hypothetical protein
MKRREESNVMSWVRWPRDCLITAAELRFTQVPKGPNAAYGMTHRHRFNPIVGKIPPGTLVVPSCTANTPDFSSAI